MYKNIAIIVAAGHGSRFNGEIPKQYFLYKNKSILHHCIDRLSESNLFDGILTVIHKNHCSLYEQATQGVSNLLPPVIGGAERQDSVRLALEAIHQANYNPQYVYIHDAARIWVDDATLHRLQEGLKHSLGCIPVIDIVDTLKEVNEDAQIIRTINRKHYKRVQTPQAFHWPQIYELHQQYAGQNFTDDAALFEAAGLKVSAVDGNKNNKKITYLQDIPQINGDNMTIFETRMGTGYDVHAFCQGDHLWLGGINIPFNKGLKGHSDADVALHAITDALFGAMGDGDIGSHFPPSDIQWKNAASDQFLIYACERLAQRGGKINNVDLTIIGEEPKITPLRDDMRQHIAEIMGVDIARISVKATTSEKLGFTGRREGLAAQAAIAIQLPC
ncbi:MAG: bifunctional 2-C-methyl-D-erythritol 4-phosphate cytidylyltransferase/2-C-methyl-D-erythritol 2,4-cyclodiphosphate synthase [Alphaproteobacteria bacterium]